MGSTVSPATSLRMTIGVFATGSINKPRIVISTSIVSSRGSSLAKSAIDPRDCSRIFSLYHQFAHQAVRKTAGYAHRNVASRLRRGGCLNPGGREIQRLILCGAADPLGAGLVVSLNHYFVNSSYIALVSGDLNLSLLRHQHFEPARLFLIGDGIFQLQRRRIRPR